MGKELRSYQKTALESIDNALERGVNKLLLVLATGLGKTYTAVQASKKYERILWITHTSELIDQSAIAFIRDMFDESFSNYVEEMGFINYVRNGGYFAGNEFKMGAIKADVFEPNGKVVIASAQTIFRRLDKLDPKMFDLIVVDEAHMSAAKSWEKTLTHFTPKLLLGLTATPTRSDNLQLDNIFDEIVYEYGIKEGIDNGYLCELDAIRIKTNISLDDVKTLGGELNQKELSDEINTPERNKLVVSSYIKHAIGRQAIFYCVNVDHAIRLSEIFNEFGVSCKPITGDEKVTPERENDIKLFKDRKIMVLTNVMVLVAGVDIPNVSCIGKASPTKSLTKYLQGVGRGTRLKDAEHVARFGQNCLILDFIDSTTRHNLVNTWTLDRGKDLEDRVFLSSESKEKILEGRAKKARMNGVERKEDEKVKLLGVLNKKLSFSARNSEPATEKQLYVLKRLGYNVDDEVYTKRMVSLILDELPAKKHQLEELKEKGFDISGPITDGQASYTLWVYNNKNR